MAPETAHTPCQNCVVGGPYYSKDHPSPYCAATMSGFAAPPRVWGTGRAPPEEGQMPKEYYMHDLIKIGTSTLSPEVRRAQGVIEGRAK